MLSSSRLLSYFSSSSLSLILSPSLHRKQREAYTALLSLLPNFDLTLTFREAHKTVLSMPECSAYPDLSVRESPMLRRKLKLKREREREREHMYFAFCEVNLMRAAAVLYNENAFIYSVTQFAPSPSPPPPGVLTPSFIFLCRALMISSVSMRLKRRCGLWRRCMMREGGGNGMSSVRNIAAIGKRLRCANIDRIGKGWR